MNAGGPLLDPTVQQLGPFIKIAGGPLLGPPLPSFPIDHLKLNRNCWKLKTERKAAPLNVKPEQRQSQVLTVKFHLNLSPEQRETQVLTLGCS